MEKKEKKLKIIAILFGVMLFLLLAPQKVLAANNEEVKLPTGDLKPNEAKLLENKAADTYGARSIDFAGSDYELYSLLEERVKEAMLSGNTIVNISDLRIKKDAYLLSYYYGYSPYFPSKSQSITAWYSSSGYYVQLSINNLESREETKKNFALIDEKLKNIYSLIDDSMTEEQKAITIHDYLVSHAEYDYSFSNYTSYGVLMNGTGVCQSYAFAYMYILNHLGVETYFLPSNSMNHAWNVIKIDTNYYNVDCTFDDPTWNGADRFGAADHTYFLRSTKEMKQLGHRFDTEPYTCTDTKYTDAYWREVDSPIYFEEGRAYYTSDGSLYGYQLSNKKVTKLSKSNDSIGISLVKKGGILYYSSGKQVYTYWIKRNLNENFLDVSEENKTIKGIVIEGENLCLQVKSGEKISLDYISLQDKKKLLGILVKSLPTKFEYYVGDSLDITGLVIEAVYSDGSSQEITKGFECTPTNLKTVGTQEVLVSYEKKKVSFEVTVKEGAGGFCGENVKWEFNKDGILTISGNGLMKNYTYKTEMPWYQYLSQIQMIKIEAGVTSIGNYAFYGMTRLSKTEIPEGMKIIGAYAFKNCTALKDIELPLSLTKLGESAFYGCSSLNQIKIPEGIYTIWAYTFKNCTSLTEISLPSTLIKLDEAAFYGCKSVKELEMPKNISIIGAYCFKNCDNLNTLVLPDVLTEVREAAFYGTALTEIIFPENVQTIGAYAFKNCTGLKTIKLSKELQMIGESAFYNCNALTTLEIPENVESISDYAFRKCAGIQEVKFSENLKTIGESSFYGCSGLTRLTFPNSLSNIGSYAFKGCINVKEIQLSSTLDTLKESVFYGCAGITSIKIPEAVKVIENYAFSNCIGLKEIMFAGTMPEIGKYAFTKVNAQVYYPTEDASWNKDKLLNYGGQLNWITSQENDRKEEVAIVPVVPETNESEIVNLEEMLPKEEEQEVVKQEADNIPEAKEQEIELEEKDLSQEILEKNN